MFEAVTDIVAVLGERPLWDEVNEFLYWVDIEGCKVFCYFVKDK